MVYMNHCPPTPPSLFLILHPEPFILGQWQYNILLLSSYGSFKESAPLNYCKKSPKLTFLPDISSSIILGKSLHLYDTWNFCLWKQCLNCLTLSVHSGSEDQCLSYITCLFLFSINSFSEANIIDMTSDRNAVIFSNPNSCIVKA